MRPLAAGSRAALAVLRFYQRYLSGLKPPTCRFWPTCSNYAVEAIGRHALRRGGWLTLRRLLRCHPFHPGGFDPVPPFDPFGKLRASKLRVTPLAPSGAEGSGAEGPPASGEEKSRSMRIRCGNE